MLLFSFLFIISTAWHKPPSQPGSLPAWGTAQLGLAAPTATPRQLHCSIQIIALLGTMETQGFSTSRA